ncbi:zinc-dependent metalloprotease [Brachybacterium sp. J144]|uniref:zinc-dependent metalloprotease n=1 Tax=Brachybacterium sp. J144 TaxID=3116487 RepID=UPI002E79B982|nr:zinc-dependent metalloprotease [Brachybacterium sp. J144]MEE1649302.1 zinc-dependent metalloprotease [Brachybacterium sp. J144]
MTDGPIPGGPGNMDEEALKRFLKETFGDALPDGALDGVDLSALAQQANLPQDPAQLRAAAAQMQHLFASQGDGPVNWQMAEDLARRTAAGQTGVPGLPEPVGSPGDPTPSAATVAELRQAAQVARLWLDPVLAIDVPSAELGVFSRGTWLVRTLPHWKGIVEPVAKYMAGAIGEAIAAQMGEMGRMDGVAAAGLPGGDPAAMMEQIGGTLFGVQFGHAIGSLAREASGTTDLSLPLGREGEPALVAANVEDLISAHSLDPGAARIFLAAREIAHTALFSAAPWLGKALFSAIEDYARGITLDLDALDEMVSGLDLSNPQSLQARRPEEMFVFTRRASQERALDELATTLALVEGWVDHVTTRALEGKIPHLDALREVLRRRRVAGSPAEQMLSSTVGIELRPRQAREALAWWDSVLATEGEQAREAKWDHPDLLPSAEMLSGRPQAPQEAPEGEESGELAGVEIPSDFDAELARLLRGEDLGSAPREDEQGRVLPGDRDGSDGPGGSSDEGPDGSADEGSADDDR